MAAGCGACAPWADQPTLLVDLTGAEPELRTPGGGLIDLLVDVRTELAAIRHEIARLRTAVEG